MHFMIQNDFNSAFQSFFFHKCPLESQIFLIQDISIENLKPLLREIAN